MDLLTSTSTTVEIVATTVKSIERYFAYQQTCNNPDQLLTASSLLVICQSILAALRQIQDALPSHGSNIALLQSTEDNISQSLSSILASCHITFKILLEKVQQNIPMTQDGASSSSGKLKDLWPTSDIEALSQSISKITSGLQLFVQAFNLYGLLSNTTICF